MWKFLKISYFLLIVALLSFLSWTSRANLGEVECQNIQIEVDAEGDLFFVNTEMVQQMILTKEDSILGKPYEDINIYLLEEFVNDHPNIKKAELYLTIDGNLCIDVKQRKPLVRVFQEKISYYLDEEIMQFPLSEIYTARVLQVYWSEITEVRRAILASMIELIEKDEFLKAQITAIEFDETDQLTIYPRLGEHKIILGDAQDLVKKFEKLKVFYRHGLEKVGWDRYSHVNLKFENQVVCTKR